MPNSSDRRRGRRSPDLRRALRLPPVVEEDRFDRLLEGWIELGNRYVIDVSLLMVSLPYEAVSPSYVTRALDQVVRMADIVGRRPDGTYALLLDADSSGARLVARRVKDVLDQGPGEASVGVVTVGPGQSDAPAALEVAREALHAALRSDRGGIEVREI